MGTSILLSKILNRNCRGENNHSAVLTNAKVRLIRLMYARGNFTQRELASRFLVSRSTIGDIVRGNSWTSTADYPVMDWLWATATNKNGKVCITVFAYLEGYGIAEIDEFIADNSFVTTFTEQFRRRYPSIPFENHTI